MNKGKRMVTLALVCYLAGSVMFIADSVLMLANHLSDK